VAAAYASWAGVRLPRDAEWEFAARGPEGREFPWGNEAPDPTRANWYEQGPRHATPVGLYPAGATPDEILDLAGNVWEWIDEWYDSARTLRVLRGGSWLNFETYLRAGERVSDLAADRVDDIGFRVARDAPAP
jgi:formylglycine-generating enzyme required for sulfatase activity